MTEREESRERTLAMIARCMPPSGTTGNWTGSSGDHNSSAEDNAYVSSRQTADLQREEIGNGEPDVAIDQAIVADDGRIVTS